MDESRLDLLEQLVARMEHYARTVTRQQLEHDLDAWLMVSRALELAAQCCVDLAMSIIARRGLGVPDTYRDAFSRLARASIISTELAGAPPGWAGPPHLRAPGYPRLPPRPR